MSIVDNRLEGNEVFGLTLESSESNVVIEPTVVTSVIIQENTSEGTMS